MGTSGYLIAVKEFDHGHLKRLEYDRQAVAERAEAAWHGDAGRTPPDAVGEVGAT